MDRNNLSPAPPAWADRLFGWICPPELHEELQGDLHEQFAADTRAFGPARARRLYVRQVLTFYRPYFLKRRTASSQTYPALNDPFPPVNQPSFLRIDMLRNYLKIALRTLWKSKGYTAINVSGLAVAFCVCTFLFMTVYRQLTFDSFHANGDRIFQTYFFSGSPQSSARSGIMPLPLGPALKTSFPELEGVTRVRIGTKSLVSYNDKYFDKHIALTDPDFLRIFSFPLVKGNRQQALQNLSGIVISESMARTIFGEQDPMGKQLRLGQLTEQKNYMVTGVMADLPDNSSIHCDALIRVESTDNYRQDMKNWDGNSYSVYLKTPATLDQATLESRLRSFTNTQFARTIADLKKEGAKPDERGDLFAIRLQKLKNVHFDRDITAGKGAPVALVYALSGLAVFILLIACINFINLTIARSFTRARELGVRKSLGALRHQLFIQIWGEALVVCLSGFLLGTGLAYSLISSFNAFFDARIDLSYLQKPGFIGLMAVIFLVVSLLAGGYPAWRMTTLRAVDVLKGKISFRRPGILRNSLIITQFTISCLLICCTVVAIQQIDFLRERPLGFSREQVISIPVGTRTNGRMMLQRFRDHFAQDPAIVSITGSSVNLGRGKDRVTSRSMTGMAYKGKNITTDWLLVDYDYLKTLNIKLLSGREFDPTYATDSVNRVIISESMAKEMGVKNPVGLFFGSDTSGTRSQIIGMVADFHLYAPTGKIAPVTMHLSHREPISYLFVRVNTPNPTAAMTKLQAYWQTVAPQAEFMASFLDENVDAWFQNEQTMSRLFSIASGIAIFLSCLGLFAVALLAIEQRTKEIGVRKVMGASAASIVVLLSRDFVKLVVIALAIALPLAWFGMQQWLNNYPYRVSISIGAFILVAAGAILVAIGTVSYQTIKAALMNPVKSLKTE
nr:FtsX-like permease family protein [uncultured Arsenicibacter sp.]